MLEKNWKILTADAATCARLQSELGINKALCEILVKRGFDTYEKAKSFFRPEWSQLPDPMLMKDMDKAVQGVIRAISENKKILVFGDYDVDGTTSVAMMYQFLKKIYPEDRLGYYLPNRYKEGYGISKKGIEYAAEHGFSLIIALDCGIKSVEHVAYAATLGIDFIICDHHLPGDEIPSALAVLNPKQQDCEYPYKELCGCGVGFQLISAVGKFLGLCESKYMCFLDLVAIAIGADIVPLTGANRILAYHGLKRINESPSAGIAAIKKLSSIERPLTISDLVFVIAPRVNAAGRMDDATHAVKLFISTNEEEAMACAEMLHKHNTGRREADMSATEEALLLLQNDEQAANRKTTVLFQPHWHKGVVGIVASRLIERYHRPTVVLAMGEKVAGGSARSVPGFDLAEAIHQCRNLLVTYGGHFAAAGLTLHPENIEAFSQKFEEVVSQNITPEMLTPQLVIDQEVSFADIKSSFFSVLSQMEPYGPENLRPVFITKNVKPMPGCRIVKEKHVKFSVMENRVTLSGIGFQLAHKFDLLQSGTPVDIVYTLEENEWNGMKKIGIKVIDFRASGD